MLFSFLCLFSLASCTKESNAGVISFHLYYNNEEIYGKVYIKYGTLSDPLIPLDQFETTALAKVSGRKHFTCLDPGNYVVHAISNHLGRRLVGKGNLTVVSRYRQNSYDVIIAMQ